MRKRTSAKVDDLFFLLFYYFLYTCSLLLAGLSYGARKHADTDAITAGQRKVIPSVYFTSFALSVPGPLEYRVKSLLRQLRIRISPVRAPFRQAEDSQHVARRAVILAVPKLTSTSMGLCAFQWELPVPGESSRSKEIPEANI